MKLPRRLLIILVLVLVAGFVALPSQVGLKDKVFIRPPINLQWGNFSFQRDLELKLGLDLAGGSHLVLEADMAGIDQADQDAALEAARQSIERRINLFGVAESSVGTAKVGSSRRVIVELPGIKDTQAAIALVGVTARLDFRQLQEPTEAAGSAFLITLENTQSTGFTGADFAKARPDFDSTTGKPIISFQTKPAAAAKFSEITTRLVGRQLAIFLDDVAISAPVVQVPITTGQGQITGDFTLEQVRELSALLNAGALPVPVGLIEQRTVEASLGAASIRASTAAGVVGLAAVVLFMISYYGRLGIIASTALFVYGVATVAIYKLLPVVLTLPGVAGFILSVGMAVDSNILIFERMKEEMRAGRPWQDGMESAFGRAWDSIRDANVATLLTAFVLFNPLNFDFLHTSGPVRGFALTLALGIAVSLFTGIFVTRTLMRVFARRE